MRLIPRDPNLQDFCPNLSKKWRFGAECLKEIRRRLPWARAQQGEESKAITTQCVI